MTENTRTLTYIGVAIVLLVAGGLVNRKPVVDSDEDAVYGALFGELKSPDAVAGLEIVTIDDSGAPTKFRVVRDSTGWSLPSHSNYPADAEKQVASAASSLIDLKVLGVVSKLPSEHATYGVLNPEKASGSTEGTGKLVNVLDKSGNSLARLIIGKKDSPAEASGAGELRFVRALPRDAVYRVSLPGEKFGTNFADWIETDLLKIDPWEITQVRLKDYTIDVGEDPRTGQPVAAYEQASTIDMTFNDKDAKWALKELVTYEENEPKSAGLADDEELNTTRLNEMKSALDDLKIVDVSRKPAGMSSSLKADKSIFNDLQAMQSLRSRGFYVVGKEGGEPEILSSNGEVLVRMKDGVEYLLRFGGVASVAGAENKEDETADTKSEAGTEDKPDEKGTTLNRYIMVSASFNKDLIPKPELEAVPDSGEAKPDTGDKEGDDAKESKKSPDANSESLDKSEAKKSDGKKSPADKNADSGKDPSKSNKEQNGDKDKSARQSRDGLHYVAAQDDDAKSAADDSKGGKSGKSTANTSAETSKANSAEAAKKTANAKSDSSAKQANPKTPDGDSNSQKAKDAKKQDGAKTGEAKKSDGQDDDKSGEKKLSAEAKEELVLERKRIEKENERKQKEYDDKVKKGEERARELNSRFADWYYVVSEATYRKIHLDRAAVIKKKPQDKKDDAKAAAGDDATNGEDATPTTGDNAGKDQDN